MSMLTRLNLGRLERIVRTTHQIDSTNSARVRLPNKFQEVISSSHSEDHMVGSVLGFSSGISLTPSGQTNRFGQTSQEVARKNIIASQTLAVLPRLNRFCLPGVPSRKTRSTQISTNSETSRPSLDWVPRSPTSHSHMVGQKILNLTVPWRTPTASLTV